MVKTRCLFVGTTALLVVAILAGTATAQRDFHLNQEWIKMWIRQDGSIDLFYNISITLETGQDIHFVTVGQPKGDFTIGNASDQYNHTLATFDASSGSDYKVQVTLYTPLTAGNTVWFTLTTNVAHMIYEDNQTNVGMEFIPSWYDAPISNLRVLIVLPLNVTTDQVGTLAGVPWNGTQKEDSLWAIYFEKQNLSPNQQYPVGVSFPKGYTAYETQPTGLIAFFQQYGSLLFVFGVLILAVVVVAVVVRKRAYLMPAISIESLGARRGLTAVEASYLLDMKPTKIVTEILYSLLQKRVVWVESTTPSVKLKMIPPFQNKEGTAETPLRYYETSFLDAVRDDGTLDEEKLAHAVMLLRDTTEEKLRGYNRRDTIDYYRKVVTKAWEQVEQAGTPDLASKAYDEQLLWLFLDPNYQARTETTFRDKAFEPSPLWLWYWFGYQHYDPHPTYKPNVETPSQSAKPPTIPGAEFANNIATAMENTSNNIVVNLEKFANAIVPFQPGRSSSEPAHHDADCVCACAACACACACVSCACACAGGGVGLKRDGVRP